ncbi:helix-turn-helix transcriptional regulator [Crassaminicella thermophila]|uniref:Helix-turn-helix transcriptional regulator n=1 Tax=Crassaminicella thermophila TaxID=2599308 RepID=A0A5C0SHB6_CRATE|nr:helix-turn-helix transcriptional regulator [Crassaminicella thermophila]QEK12618.1 helix-turn-helix transcriptional regulator [Crassaminicella thermophila]
MKLCIKEVREEVGIRITELARRSGVSQSYLSELEAGKKKNVSMTILCRLAKALDVHVSVLFNCDE